MTNNTLVKLLDFIIDEVYPEYNLAPMKPIIVTQLDAVSSSTDVQISDRLHIFKIKQILEYIENELENNI